MSDLILEQIIAFFDEVYSTQVHADDEWSPDGVIRGWAETWRPTFFTSPCRKGLTYHEVVLRDIPIQQATVYRVVYQPVSFLYAIVALMPSGVLWLDNHYDEADLITLLNEHVDIFTLTNEPHNIIQLIIQTKLDYLGHPHLITSIDDIPPSPYDSHKWWTRRKIRQFITSPSVSQNAHYYEISFCIWTEILSRILRIKCRLSTNIFKYQSEKLIVDYGDGRFPI